MPTLLGRYKVPHFDTKGEANQRYAELDVPTTCLHTSFCRLSDITARTSEPSTVQIIDDVLARHQLATRHATGDAP